MNIVRKWGNSSYVGNASKPVRRVTCKEEECTFIVINNLYRLHRKIKRQNDRSPTCELTNSSDTHDTPDCHNVSPY